MSDVLCTSCGYIKTGSFVPCLRCGESGNWLVGLGLSSHVFTHQSLAEVGKIIEMIYDQSPTIRFGRMVVAHYLQTLDPSLIKANLPEKYRKQVVEYFERLQIPRDVRLEKIDFEDTSFGDFLENSVPPQKPTDAELKTIRLQLRNSQRKWEKEMSEFREKRRLRLEQEASEEPDSGTDRCGCMRLSFPTPEA